MLLILLFIYYDTMCRYRFLILFCSFNVGNFSINKKFNSNEASFCHSNNMASSDLWKMLALIKHQGVLVLMWIFVGHHFWWQMLCLPSIVLMYYNSKADVKAILGCVGICYVKCGRWNCLCDTCCATWILVIVLLIFIGDKWNNHCGRF